jgi:hypothetical protein
MTGGWAGAATSQPESEEGDTNEIDTIKAQLSELQEKLSKLNK